MGWKKFALAGVAVMLVASIGCSADQVVTEEDVWEQAKENASGDVILRPTWMPEGFEIAEEYDGGDRAGSKSPNTGAPGVQYNRGDETILIRFGVGDLGETKFERVQVRGRDAALVESPGSVILVWSESDDSEVDQYLEGIGEGVSVDDMLRLAESLVEY